MAYPLPVATLLRDMLKKYGLEPQIRFYQLIDHWEKLVGPQIAMHTLPAQLKFRKLTLHVDSSAWMNQLNYLKEELMEKINRELGQDWVKEVYLKIGPVVKPKEENSGEEIPGKLKGSLPPDQAALVEKWVEIIEDPLLKEKFRQVMTQDLLRSGNLKTVNSKPANG